MSAPRTFKARKLLVATLGVATVSYVGCGSGPLTSGNLLPPPPYDGAATDARPGADARADAPLPITGNLLPPPPLEAGTDRRPDAVRDAAADRPVDRMRDARRDGGGQ